MAAPTSALSRFALVPTRHQGRRSGGAARASAAAPKLARSQLMGSRVHADGALCYIGAMPKDVAKKAGHAPVVCLFKKIFFQFGGVWRPPKGAAHPLPPYTPYSNVCS
jgi:hypothetical protein